MERAAAVLFGLNLNYTGLGESDRFLIYLLMDGVNPLPMNAFKQVWRFYYEGFKTMGPVGKKLWIIVLIKLFIMFAILRLFFFPDVMEEKFSSDRERTDHIIEEITKP